VTDGAWLITGCSTGFGRALAEVLLARGDSVVATARRTELLEPLIAAYPQQVLGLRLDVTRPGDVAAGVAAARERFGAIAGLINNAGHGTMALVEDGTVAVARAMMEVHFFAVLDLVKAVLPEMRARRSGSIVNIGSVAGQIGFPAISHYCASKFALAGFTESLAAELGPLGIRVMLAELGPFATDFIGSMQLTLPGSPDYDLAAMSAKAGNSHWSPGADPHAGARALLAALEAEEPPVRIVLGPEGLEVADLHDARRRASRERWRETGMLAGFAEGPPDQTIRTPG
jgi:NAD(P)-dependent dehydrogenase (short-subunit alcohol dehydrogenase family)